MAYNEESLTKLKALKQLAQRVNQDFATKKEMQAAVQEAITAANRAVYQTASSIPTLDEAKDNVLYLVMNEQTQHYDIYAKVGEEVVLLDDTTVDLSGYVQKETGKGLSSNDFTDALKAKLDGLELASTDEVAEMLTEVFGAEE